MLKPALLCNRIYTERDQPEPEVIADLVLKPAEVDAGTLVSAFAFLGRTLVPPGVSPSQPMSRWVPIMPHMK